MAAVPPPSSGTVTGKTRNHPMGGILHREGRQSDSLAAMSGKCDGHKALARKW
ncbi:hypothetical protein [Azospirillum argentinense]